MGFLPPCARLCCIRFLQLIPGSMLSSCVGPLWCGDLLRPLLDVPRSCLDDVSTVTFFTTLFTANMLLG